MARVSPALMAARTRNRARSRRSTPDPRSGEVGVLSEQIGNGVRRPAAEAAFRGNTEAIEALAKRALRRVFLRESAGFLKVGLDRERTHEV